MAKRIRRNLSDKKIRKIIKNKTRPNNHPHLNDTRKGIVSYFKSGLFIVAMAVVAILVFRLIHTTDFTQFFFSTNENKKVAQAVNKSQDTKLASEQESESPSPTEKTQQPVTHPVPAKMQIDVLNGCGADGVAMKATEFFRQQNIDVVDVRNYKNFDVRTSMIIDWVGNKETAEKIAQIIGIEKSQITTRPDKSKQLDASVILGKDYQQLKPFNQ